MPIRPENRERYPKNWKAISLEVREAAGWRCEGSPAFPSCRAVNAEPHPSTGSTVVLTVAHLDHQPENCERENLKAWCQRCHNTYDMPMRRAGIAERARQALNVVEMFPAATEDGSQHLGEPREGGSDLSPRADQTQTSAIPEGSPHG